MTDSPGPNVDVLNGFSSLPGVAQVEHDTLCENCGYNLHMQAVRRDPRTGILLIRCPECGRFHAAPVPSAQLQVWMRRGITCLSILWVFALLALIGLAFVVEAVITSIWIEKFGSVLRGRYGDTRQWDGSWWTLSELREPAARAFAWLIGGIGISALLTGFVVVGVATVTFPHWPRWGYKVYAFVLPVTAVVPLYGIAAANRYYLADAALRPWLVMLTAVFVAGGLAGAVLGRSLARGIVILLIPPFLRPYLAFLWLVDGRQLPLKTMRGA